MCEVLWKGIVFGVDVGLAIGFAVANLSNIIKQSLDSTCVCLRGSSTGNEDVDGKPSMIHAEHIAGRERTCV